ncbi:histone deacetylase 19-like [Lolium rigidum]|uniref:histone deacetylase 19-like n=1 Tax=Lolium rigidum TaxID=89674 RepID=UPI001F5DCBBE|nr:histone deacetylase 19-like [Lolium rigidum]
MNWADGLYPNDSSGSVILNDVVLGVLDLLKSHERIIYIDVGVHHVDGVEKSFIRSNKVMTISFNKYGDFSSYMSTDIGVGRGKHHALNVSLGVRTKDDDFIGLFQTIIQKAISVFNPNLIVLQTGIESLAPDHADCFSLSAESHLRCLSILRIFGLPIMILGNIVHCWCSESGLLGKYNFGENQSVNDNVVKLNNTENLDEIRDRVLSHLAIIEEVPIKGFKDTNELQTEMIDDIIDDDIDWDREAYDFVEGLSARPKAWSNPFARQAAKAVNRIGRGLGSQQSVLMEYNDMLNPYTDFLNYVGHFDSVSDGCVTPALRTISTASRTIGSVSAFAGSMLKYGARALGKHGRSFQMIARPEAGLLGDGPKREQVLLVTSLEEVQAVITKWTYDELQDVKVDVPEDMPLEEAETIGAYLNIAKATELISDKSFLIQKIKRSVLKR